MLGFGKRLGNTANERFVARGKALLHKGGIAADKVDADGLRRLFQGFCIQNGVTAACGNEHRNRRDGNALVNNRNAVFLFDVFPGFDQVLCLTADFVIHLVTGTGNIRIRTAQQRNAHGDGAYIQIFLSNHIDGFEYIVRVNHTKFVPFVKFCAWN